MNGGWSLFLGAFFAFLFTGLAAIFAKIHERQKRHYNALVEFEYFCCENMDLIYSNICIIDDFEGLVGKKLEQGQPAVYGNKMRKLNFNDKLILDLNNLDFVNKVLSYKVDLGRINHDIENINNSYADFKMAFMQKTIDFETYKFNTLYTIQTSIEFKKHLKRFEEKTENIGAYTRVLSREDKPWFTRFIQFLFKKKAFDEKFKKEIEVENKKIKAERAEIMEESKKEKEEILKKTNST